MKEQRSAGSTFFVIADERRRAFTPVSIHC